MNTTVSLDKDERELLKAAMPIINAILAKQQTDACLSLPNHPTEDLTSLQIKVKCISEVGSYLALHTEKP